MSEVTLDRTEESSRVIDPPSPQAESSILTTFVNWWNNCPLFTKSLIYSTLIMGILSLPIKLRESLENIPSRTVGSFEIYRLLTSPFVSKGIVELLVSYALLLPICTIHERSWGTLKTLGDFFLRNLEINLIFVFLCYILSLFSSSLVHFASLGLLNIFFVFLMESVVEKPNENVMFLCLPFEMKNKYYPFALFFIFCFVTGSFVFRLDLLIAIAVGYLHRKHLHTHVTSILNDGRISKWHSSPFGNFLKNYANYIPPSGDEPRDIESQPHKLVKLGSTEEDQPSDNDIAQADHVKNKEVHIEKDEKEINKIYGELDDD